MTPAPPAFPGDHSWLVCRRKPRPVVVAREQLRYEAMQAKASAIRIAHVAAGNDERAREARRLLLAAAAVLEMQTGDVAGEIWG